MRHLIILLLFVSAAISAQDTLAVSSGGLVTYGGGGLIITDAMIPKSPIPDTTEFIDSSDYYININFGLAYDDNELGAYSETKLADDYTQGGWTTYGWTHGMPGSDKPADNVYIIDTPEAINGSSSKAIRVLHKADSAGLIGVLHEPTYPEGSGAKFETSTASGSGYQELYLSYNFMWCLNADMQINGKQPTISGHWDDVSPTDVGGFHARMNFQGDRLGKTYGSYMWYAKWADKDPWTSGGNGEWATDNGTGDTIAITTTEYEWHNMTVRCWANTSDGSTDGGMQAFIDGVLVNGTSTGSPFYNLALMNTALGVAYREINKLSFEFFLGGNTDGRDGTADFAPETDVYWYSDDYYMWTPKAAYGAPASHTPWTSGSVLPYIPGYDVRTKTKTERYVGK